MGQAAGRGSARGEAGAPGPLGWAARGFPEAGCAGSGPGPAGRGCAPTGHSQGVWLRAPRVPGRTLTAAHPTLPRRGPPGIAGSGLVRGGPPAGPRRLPLPAGALAEDALARGRPEVAPSVFRGELETFPSRGRQPRQLKAWRVEAAGPAAPPGLC